MNGSCLKLAAAAAVTLGMSAPVMASVEWSAGWAQASPSSVRSDEITLGGERVGSRVTGISRGDSWFVGAGYRITPEMSVAVKYSNDLSHGVEERGLGIGNIGRFDMDVLTITGRYHFLTEQIVQPYVQGGLLHVGFRKAYASIELADAVGASAMRVNSGTGWTAGAGLDVRASENIFLFGEVNISGVNVQAHYDVGPLQLRARNIDADPVIYRVGIRYRL